MNRDNKKAYGLKLSQERLVKAVGFSLKYPQTCYLCSNIEDIQFEFNSLTNQIRKWYKKPIQFSIVRFLTCFKFAEGCLHFHSGTRSLGSQVQRGFIHFVDTLSAMIYRVKLVPTTYQLTTKIFPFHIASKTQSVSTIRVDAVVQEWSLHLVVRKSMALLAYRHLKCNYQLQ